MLSVTYYDETPKVNRKKILVIGKTKSGKTYLSGTCPSPFIIDTDNSLDGLGPGYRHVPHVTMTIGSTDRRRWTLRVNGEDKEFKPFDLMCEHIRAIRDKKPPFDKIKVETVVLDSMTAMAKLFLIESSLDVVIGRTEKKADGSRDPIRQKPTWDEYSAALYKFRILFSILEDCNVDIFATAGIKLDKDEDTGSFVLLPNIEGSFRNEIGSYFTGVFYLEEANGKHFLHRTKRNAEVGVRNWDGTKSLENPTYKQLLEHFV